MSNSWLQNQPRYVRLFLKANGPGPFVCYFCRKPVAVGDSGRDRFTIHHKDHNHDNNRKSNLKPCHKGCHTSHHRLGVPQRKESVEKMRASLKKRYAEGMPHPRGMAGKKQSEESRRLISEGVKNHPEVIRTQFKKGSVSPRKGVRVSEESRAKMSAAKRGKPWSEARRKAAKK
jgi:hypothetical protein